MAKETFYLEHQHLKPDERDRLWSAQTAELSGVLASGAPQHRVDLDSVPEHAATDLDDQTTESFLERRERSCAV